MKASCAIDGRARWVSGLYTLCALLLLTLPARAQLLQGEWVARTDADIDRHRKAEIRIIVLGRDGLQVPDASVHVEQVRHDFQLGLVVGDAGFPADLAHRPVYRLFNAIALDRLIAWPRIQPAPDALWPASLVNLIRDARAQGLAVRWGGLVSADAGRWPDWVASLQGDALRNALLAHADHTLADGIDSFDVYTHSLDHDDPERRLGTPILRRLFDHVGAAAPRAARCVRFEDALTAGRVQTMIERCAALQQSFVDFDAVAIEQRVGGILVQAPLARVFEVIAGLDKSVTLASLEVGGASDVAAAINLQTFLRTAFAQPRVTGIFFAGLHADDLADPTAALLDADNRPTPAGETLDDLFRTTWWTDLHATTDELGNAYLRAFFGEHRITATLPDGTTLTTRIYLHPGDPQRLIVLEPMQPHPQ